jgi:ribonuclease D
LKLDKPRSPVVVVDNQVIFDEFLASLAETNDAIGLDAERASGFKFSNRAYLLQISIYQGSIYLLDPIDLDQYAPDWNTQLAKAIEHKTWLLHAATQDLPCLQELGIRPSSLIDTELAARIAGMEKVGLGSLCAELLDLELAKEHSAADWSLRPLSPAMLDYAALDVDVLHELWEKIEANLIEQGKLDWALQDFENLLSFQPKAPLDEPWRGLPGLSKIKDLSKLKVAASIWQARNAIAIERDVAPGRLIPDRSVMAAVVAVPKSKSELANNKEFQGRASRSLLATWWEAIEKAPRLEVELQAREKGNGIPSHRSWEKRFPEAHARLEIIRPVMLELATELSLPIENLLTPDYLRRVCFEPQENIERQLGELGARQWQIELVAGIISEGLEKTRQTPESPELA